MWAGTAVSALAWLIRKPDAGRLQRAVHDIDRFGPGRIRAQARVGQAQSPQMSRAVSTIRLSLATCSSEVSALPSTVEENPHWPDRQS